jgi:RimJ/RimL family protein N-acetyltransferase
VPGGTFGHGHGGADRTQPRLVHLRVASSTLAGKAQTASEAGPARARARVHRVVTTFRWVRFVLTRDAEEFAHQVGPFIEARLECNVLDTVLLGVLDRPVAPEQSSRFAYGIGADGEVGFAALRTPPWQLLTSELSPDLAPDFMARWLEFDPEVPGVNGLPASAQGIAAAWAAQTGGTTRCWMREAMQALEHVVDPPRPAPGQLRPAREDERQQMIEWTAMFERESGIGSGDRAAEMVDSKMRQGGLLLWDAGEPVSFLAVTPPVAEVVRIGPVYTPPEHRRRGYAGTAVAAASRRALAAGAERCMLFTDLSNPTSNKIYAEVGYRRIADWEEHAFEPPTATT